MQRLLISIGLIIIVLGIAWPWLSRLGLGRLPGDLHINKDGFNFYFPITSSILVSLVISLIFWLFKR